MKFLKYFLIFLAVLVAVLIAKGLMTPSVAYECEIVVDKSAKEAWAVMSDEANLPKWIAGFIKTELVSGTANTIGAVSNVYVDEGGQEMMMKETITDFKLNELMAMRFTMDMMDTNYEMRFKENDGQTTITTKSTTFGNGILNRIMISFMPSAMKQQEDENLNNLKALIDSNTKNYFPAPVIDTNAVISE